MQIIKKIFGGLILFISAFALFSGCTKFLDRKPLQATLSDLNQGGLEGQAIGLYGTIRNSHSHPIAEMVLRVSVISPCRVSAQETRPLMPIPEQPAILQPIQIFNTVKTNGRTVCIGTGIMQLILLANILLQTADSLKLSDPASLINIAEGKWFRAYAYFDLVKNYGEVPIITKRIYQPSDGQVPKSPGSRMFMRRLMRI